MDINATRAGGTVLLRLPTEAEVSAKERLVEKARNRVARPRVRPILGRADQGWRVQL